MAERGSYDKGGDDTVDRSAAQPACYRSIQEVVPRKGMRGRSRKVVDLLGFRQTAARFVAQSSGTPTRVICRTMGFALLVPPSYRGRAALSGEAGQDS